MYAEKGTKKELVPSPCELVQFLVPEKGTRSVHVPPKKELVPDFWVSAFHSLQSMLKGSLNVELCIHDR